MYRRVQGSLLQMDSSFILGLNPCGNCVYGIVCKWFEMQDETLSSEENFKKSCAVCHCWDADYCICRMIHGSLTACPNYESKPELLTR